MKGEENKRNQERKTSELNCVFLESTKPPFYKCERGMVMG